MSISSMSSSFMSSSSMSSSSAQMIGTESPIQRKIESREKLLLLPSEEDFLKNASGELHLDNGKTMEVREFGSILYSALRLAKWDLECSRALNEKTADSIFSLQDERDLAFEALKASHHYVNILQQKHNESQLETEAARSLLNERVQLHETDKAKLDRALRQLKNTQKQLRESRSEKRKYNETLKPSETLTGMKKTKTSTEDFLL